MGTMYEWDMAHKQQDNMYILYMSATSPCCSVLRPAMPDHPSGRLPNLVLVFLPESRRPKSTLLDLGIRSFWASTLSDLGLHESILPTDYTRMRRGKKRGVWLVTRNVEWIWQLELSSSFSSIEASIKLDSKLNESSGKTCQLYINANHKVTKSNSWFIWGAMNMSSLNMSFL